MFDFKENLDKRAKHKEEYQNYVASQKEDFDRMVEEFKNTYLEWYKQCEELRMLNNVDCFLRDIGFECKYHTSLYKSYTDNVSMSVELYQEDIAKNETLPFRFGIVAISYRGNTSFLKLLGDKIEDTTDPMPF